MNDKLVADKVWTRARYNFVPEDTQKFLLRLP